MTLEVVRQWLGEGRLDLPLPGSGATAQRWRRLGELAGVDLVAARIAEAHVDAVAILDELTGKPIQRHQLWAVWAAEASDATLCADERAEATVLTGRKAWCSGATWCSHALVTARLPDGQRGLYAVELAEPGVHPLPISWRSPGMSGSDTRSVQFTEVPATPVGEPGRYLHRPGFWHGAIGVAACWLGGARVVAEPLYDAAQPDAHALAHLGAVDAALAGAEAMLAAAAAEVDADPGDRTGRAELTARRVRALVEVAVDEAITRVGRALGAGPLCLNGRHARYVADLSVYVRQSHAERDLAGLGALAGRNRGTPR